MICFVKIKRPDGITETNVYTSMEQYHADTFCPDAEILCFLPLRVQGKSYTERKENAMRLAIEIFSCDNGDTDIGLSWHETDIICDYLSMIGQKYDLIQEFVNNGIL